VFRTVAFAVTLLLTGTPAALACIGSCAIESAAATADEGCRHRVSTAPRLEMAATSEECATPLAAAPFLVEAQHRSSTWAATAVELIETIAGSVAGGSPVDRLVPAGRPPVRPSPSHSLTTVLRI
jgi:hypothetical protein